MFDKNNKYTHHIENEVDHLTLEVKNMINKKGVDELFDFKNIILSEDFITCFHKPRKRTALHCLLREYYAASVEYWRKHSEPPLLFRKELIQALYYKKNYKRIKTLCLSKDEFKKSLYYQRDKIGTSRKITNYDEYILILYKIEIFPDIVQKTFDGLFFDKKFLTTFNLLIASEIRKTKVEQYPNLLDKDGKVKRVTLRLTWVEKALMYRERGKCAMEGCSESLNYSDALEAYPHIDHIIPLNQGGVNDVTNLQMLCRKCNLKKSDKTGFESKSHIPTLWKIDEW